MPAFTRENHFSRSFRQGPSIRVFYTATSRPPNGRTSYFRHPRCPDLRPHTVAPSTEQRGQFEPASWRRLFHGRRSAFVSASKESPWETTAVQNLVRYRPYGPYFARFRVGGKLIWKNVKTSAFSVAKQPLPDTIRDHRAKLESAAAFASGKMTVVAAIDAHLTKVRSSASLKPRSIDYREMIVGFSNRSWPTLLDTDARKISERDCQEWLMRLQQKCSASLVNNAIGTLHAVFEEIVRSGARFSNPAANLARMRIRPEESCPCDSRYRFEKARTKFQRNFPGSKSPCAEFSTVMCARLQSAGEFGATFSTCVRARNLPKFAAPSNGSWSHCGSQ